MADDEHPRKAFAEKEAGEYADEDWRELDEHGSSASVDSLLASIERDAVDREPGDSDQCGERPLPGCHTDQLAADHHGAEGDAGYEQPSEGEGTRTYVVCRIADHDEG